MVLEREGYEVVVSSELPVITELLVSQTIQIFILCHSLTQGNRECALGASHSFAAHTTNLILSPNASYSSEKSSDAVLSEFVNPRILIDRLRQITCRRRRTTEDERQLQALSASIPNDVLSS